MGRDTTDRTLFISLSPELRAAASPPEEFICSSAIAARQLGYAPRNLDDAARDLVRQAGQTVASEGRVLRTLRNVLHNLDMGSDRGGMARAMLPSINLLFRSGADLELLQRKATERVSRLAGVALLVRRSLADFDSVAIGDAMGAAASTARINRKQLVVYGYPRFSRLELELIDQYAAPGSELYLPFHADSPLFADNDDAVTLLRLRGWTVVEHAPQRPDVGVSTASAFLQLAPCPEATRAWSFSTRDAEVRGVLGAIKRGVQNGDFAPEEAVIVTRSESEYGPIIHEIAWEYGIPVQTHHAIPFFDTRLGRWFNNLLETADTVSFPFEGTARVVRHALGNRLVGAAWTDSSWNSARAAHTRGADEWQDLGLQTSALIWPDQQERSKWCIGIGALLRSTTVQELCKDRPQDLSAFEALNDAIADLRAVEQKDDTVLTRADFIDELRDTLQTATVPFNGRRAGIQIHTPLSLYGAKADHVFVVGTSEGGIPRQISDDTFFDFHDRRRLAAAGLVRVDLDVIGDLPSPPGPELLLLSAAQAAKRETLSFYALLLAASKSITLSYPRLTGSGVGRPSAFLTRLNLEIVHDPDHGCYAASRLDLVRLTLHNQEPAAILDVDENRTVASMLDRGRLAWSIVKNRESCDGIDAFTGSVGPGIVDRNHRFSPSRIELFGRCAYSWFGARILHLKEPDEADEDLGGADRGNLYHDTLNIAVQECYHAPDLRSAVLDRLEQSLDEALNLEQNQGITRLSGWNARRQELLAQLREAVEADDFLRPGATIIATEVEFAGEWRGLPIGGRIDRIDRIGSALYVIDYKTSGSKPAGAQDENRKLGVDVQLPIYIEAGTKQSEIHETARGGYYYSLTTGKILDKYQLEPKPKAINEPALEQLVTRIHRSLDRGEFAVAPDSMMGACAYCELDLLCRRGPHLQRTLEAKP